MKRRQFLQNTSTYIAGAALIPSGLNAAKKISPNGKINVAAIGINGMGWADITNVIKNPQTQLVALCDVDKRVLNERMADLAKQNLKPVTYGDYRKVLDDKNI